MPFLIYPKTVGRQEKFHPRQDTESISKLQQDSRWPANAGQGRQGSDNLSIIGRGFPYQGLARPGRVSFMTMAYFLL